MQSITLSDLLDRMNRYQKIAVIEEQYKVRDLDEAIRTLRREFQTPWSLKKSTLRVFDDVLTYPVADDHDQLAYLDNQLDSNNLYDTKARFFFTSLQQFYENPDYRNDLAEIWDGGTKYLGVRYKTLNAGSQRLSGKTLANYAASGDASGLALDGVIFKEDNQSISFVNTPSTNVATVVDSFTSFSDSEYKRKYYFRWIYLTALPTSITLKFGNDSSDYLYKILTTQFSGQGFKVNDWNLLGMDLNTATPVGTITNTAFDWESVSLNSAPIGNYYIDNSYLRDWTLMDYWYYSTYYCMSSVASVADQEYFFNGASYALDTSLIGDINYIDVVLYDAILTGLADSEDKGVIELINSKRKQAWVKLEENYPSMKPIIITSKHTFTTDFLNEGLNQPR